MPIDDTATTHDLSPASILPASDRYGVALQDGVTIGGITYHEARLRDLTAHDLMAAQEASERVVHSKGGIALVSSPARMGTELLRRQVLSLHGDGPMHNGPLSTEELGRLTMRDFDALRTAVDALDLITALRDGEALDTRGRDVGGDAKP